MTSGSSGSDGTGESPRIPQVTLRRAVEEEAVLLTGIARASKASWGYPQSWLHEWEDALSLSPAYMREHQVWVAEVSGAVVGLVALEDSEPEAELAHLWVLPGWQGRGVGRRLAERALAWAREAGRASIRIESDPNAVAFYLRLGAVRVGEVPAPVAGRRRALPLLRLTLDEA